MKLKLSLQRQGGDERDIVITADATATVGEVASAIQQRDPSRTAAVAASDNTTLVVRFPGDAALTTLASNVPLSEASVASGASIVLAAGQGAVVSTAGPALAYLRVVAGPDRGKEFALRAGSAVIGRQAGVEIELSDPLVSKRHARVEVTRTVDLVDLNSANGLIVDGVEVTRIGLDSGQSVVIGDSELRAELVVNSVQTDAPLARAPWHTSARRGSRSAIRERSSRGRRSPRRPSRTRSHGLPSRFRRSRLPPSC
jgi:S-DNA-T family DNA segregation ATPase FtsK/SpoIIIE